MSHSSAYIEMMMRLKMALKFKIIENYKWPYLEIVMYAISHQHVGSKIAAKIEIYTHTRAL